MANDLSIVQDGQTAYVWGGWNASGFRTMMYVIDVQTGAMQVIPIDRVRFLAQGFVTNADWTWIAGKLLYLAANGAMTQTRPLTGPCTILGIAWSPTTICLDIQPPKNLDA